jgi:hypothetical protein
MQGAVNDALIAEAQHQKNIVLVQSGLARNERRITVEVDAGGGNRSLILRRGNDRVDLAGERGTNGATGTRQGRAAVAGIALAEREGETVRHLRLKHVERAVCPLRILYVTDEMKLRRQSRCCGMFLDHNGIADHDRTAHGGDARIERRLQADFGPDP